MKNRFSLILMILLILFSLSVFGEETNCTDGKDNDGDYLVDCADDDCSLDLNCSDIINLKMD